MNNIRQENFEKIFKQHLKIETYSKAIDSLLGPRSINKINYSPYYQRNYVWDNKSSLPPAHQINPCKNQRCRNNL